jgi:hypothetical protein
MAKRSPFVATTRKSTAAGKNNQAIPSEQDAQPFPLQSVLMWLVIGVLSYALFRDKFLPSHPVNTGTLGKAFETNDDRDAAVRDAHIFATLCVSLADAIEYDSKQSAPRLRTGTQVDDLRRAVREYRMKGASFAMKYPALPGAVDAFITSRVGTSGGPLDVEQRKKWIAAFRELSHEAEEIKH